LDGKKFNWTAVETVLDLCKKHKLAIDFCIGPFQYPNYPGIYFPPALLAHVFDTPNSLDTRAPLREFGFLFLEKQMERYGNDKRITSFHFANEWPDKQNVKDKEQIKAWVSTAFMVEAAKYLTAHTTKVISLNTNIDASDKRRLSAVFAEVLEVLGEQASLGFDIYPSQETWRKAFFQKLRRIIEPYERAFAWSCRRFPDCSMYFCEVEAQPWGSGQSWYKMISDEPHPEEKVLHYTNNSLQETFDTYLSPSEPEIVSLWGVDFWLVAKAMHIDWPLAQVSSLAKKRQKRR